MQDTCTLPSTSSRRLRNVLHVSLQRPSADRPSQQQRIPKLAITQEIGQEVSVDHFICSTLGRLYTGYGKTDDASLYRCRCIFVDNAAASWVHVEHQISLTSHETLDAKQRFEFACRDYGVIVQSYLSDNGAAFTSNGFANHLARFEQTIRFAGVGAHHHNGIAEKEIQDVMSITRTLLLHAAIYWPDVADAQLWPMAVDHAVFLHNHMPREDLGLPPHDLFTKHRWPHANFRNLHVWGCPLYTLDKKIADGFKLPRWTPRSIGEIYMGHSKRHASTVPIGLNRGSGAITSNFHVVFDDWFATVSSTVEQLPDLNSVEWKAIFGDSEYQYPLDNDPIGNVGTASYDPPLSMDSFDIDDSQ
jgi:hypothetical protein